MAPSVAPVAAQIDDAAAVWSRRARVRARPSKYLEVRRRVFPCAGIQNLGDLDAADDLLTTHICKSEVKVQSPKVSKQSRRGQRLDKA
jgi:hypothetical protein